MPARPPDLPTKGAGGAEGARDPREVLGEVRCRALGAGPEFWAEQSRRYVRWKTPFSRALDWEPPFARWFPDGALNAADHCLERHRGTPVESKVAYHWEGEPGERRDVTFRALADEVARWSSALTRAGFGAGDTAAIYLPMIPELPTAMLALARVGIAFTVVFSGFSAAALSHRLEDLGATLVITADGGYRRGKTLPLKATVDTALERPNGVRTVVVVPRLDDRAPITSGRDVGLGEFLDGAPPAPPPAAFPSTHPLYYLYSSGTTGRPKAIVHGTGGYLTHVSTTFDWVFGPRPEDVFWCAADIGWVTGHSYIVFAPLAAGTTGILYEGAFDTPSPDRLFEMVERYGVTILYTSPTALRALRRQVPRPRAVRRLDSLRLLGTVGEAINPAVWTWYHEEVGAGRCPIVDTWWQTETGGALVSAVLGIANVPPKPGSATYPVPGVDVEVVDETGAPAPADQRGFVVVRRPWPGMLLTLRGDPDRYRQTYWSRFPGVYYTGDYARRDSEGYLWFLGRADEVLKVAGHRLGTIEIEDALLSDPRVAEAAVCGRPDPERGEVPAAFVVLRPGVRPDAALAEELRTRVVREIGGIARPAEVVWVTALPKTRSGKILRRVVRAVAQGEASVGDITTLEDEASVEEVRHGFEEFRRQLKAAGR